jgi:hypothetical protein
MLIAGDTVCHGGGNKATVLSVWVLCNPKTILKRIDWF